MKTSAVTFSQLRHLLLGLGFTESRPDGFWRFEHSPSGAVFLFRPYAANDNLSLPDLSSTRTHLEWRGVLSSTAFDDSLTKTPA
jgi:hypothetical protein